MYGIVVRHVYVVHAVVYSVRYSCTARILCVTCNGSGIYSACMVHSYVVCSGTWHHCIMVHGVIIK